MRIIFLDMEYSALRAKKPTLCSIGYLECDINLSIIEAKDIIMRPVASFDLEVEDILYYPKEYYNSYNTLKDNYDILTSLFKDSIVIGHDIIGDLIRLNSDIKYYKLKPLDFTFFDSQLLYRSFFNLTGCNPSLQKILNTLKLPPQGARHRSIEDSYLTYLYTKRLVELSGLQLMSLLYKYPGVRGVNNSGIPYTIKPVTLPTGATFISYKPKGLKPQDESIKILMDNLIKGSKPNKKGRLLGEVVFIDKGYLKNEGMKALLIIKLIYKEGGILSRSIRNATIFISYSKFKSLDLALLEIANKECMVMDINRLYSIIGYKRAMVIPNYEKLLLDYSKGAI